MKTNRIHTGLLKIITRSHLLKPREAECITRNTIWELLLPTRSSYFFADRQRGRGNQQAQPLVRKTTSEYAKPMRKLCENYEKTIAHKPSANRLAVWLAVSLAPWLLESASQSYPESRASLVRAQRAHDPSCLGFKWFWGVPRQSIARAAAGQGGPYFAEALVPIGHPGGSGASAPRAKDRVSPGHPS